VTGKAQLKHN